MRVAVVSDIHGNRHAFEAVLADVAATGADELWCLGDLVGYGADPDACVELAQTPDAAILLRESDDPRTVITTTPAALRAFTRSVRAGRLDHLFR